MQAIPGHTETSEAIAEFFEKAEMVPSLKLWRALWPSDPRLSGHAEPGKVFSATFAFWETHELQKLLRQIENILGQGTENEEDEIRIKLLAYCQIMECDLPLALVWNVLRVIGDEEPRWIFRENGQDCIYSSQKLKAITLRADSLQLHIGHVLSSIWDLEIRNAFAHGHYILGHGYVLLSKLLSPISSGGKRRSSRRAENPSYQEVRDRYEAAKDFLVTLSDAHSNFYQKMRVKHQHFIANAEPS